MPFVGENTQKTVANLAQEYPEYKQWLRLEKKVEKYQNVLGNFIEELKASGKYSDREIEFINDSLAPQKAHIYPKGFFNNIYINQGEFQNQELILICVFFI